MSVSLTFSVFAFVAVTLHLFSLREAMIDRSAVQNEKLTAEVDEVTIMGSKDQVRIELSRLVVNVLLLVAGVGAITAHPIFIYSIVGIPVVSVIGSLLDIRSRRRQFQMLQS